MAARSDSVFSPLLPSADEFVKGVFICLPAFYDKQLVVDLRPALLHSSIPI
jgi:hypothetical protein